MIIEAINEYRHRNGRGPVSYWNPVIGHYCQAHTDAMVDKGDVYHAPGCYLKDYGEAVGAHSFQVSFAHTIYLMLEEFNRDDKHRNILLNSQEMGHGVRVEDGMLYITIRGR